MDKKNTLIFWIVMVLAALVIVAGIIFSQLQPTTYKGPNDEIKQYSVEPINDNDHIIGNPNADVILVEYGDYACPYCREFHPTMKRLMQEYGKDGSFAWVYRHFPSVDAITEEKTISKVAAVAAECVNESVGNNGFWDFTDGVFLNLPKEFSEIDLRELAISLGMEEEEYDKCIVSDKFEQRIQRNIKDGLEIYNFDSNFGTPYNIIITKTGTQLEVVGAQPYEIIEQLILQHSFPDSL